MSCIFISGSRRINDINSDIKERVNSILAKEHTILVGDANGVDKAIQQYLFERNYRNVIVFCSGEQCRNNLGNWATEFVKTNTNRRDFNFYAQKDLEMARKADYGFVIWDTKSKGSLNNIIKLIRDKKKTTIYIYPQKCFYIIDDAEGLRTVLKQCSSKSLPRLEALLGFSKVLRQDSLF